MKFRSIILIIGFIAGTASSCSELLEAESQTQITKDQALQDGGVDGLLLSAYNLMQSTGLYGSNNMVEADVLADNVKATFNSNRYASEYENDGAQGHINIYNAVYTIINDVNLVIENVDDPDNGLTDQERSQIKGEAYAIRALMYHDLARAYGYEPGREVNSWNEGVIVRVEAIASAGDADLRARMSNEEVYTQIESDYLTAISNLSNTGANNRFTQAAAQALLARVYLYWEKWDQAEAQATAAINSGVATLVSSGNYDDAWWGANHPEAFFELVFDPITENVGPNNALFSLCTLVSGAWGDLAATPDLMSQFEPGDVRADLFYVADGETYPTKWTGSAGDNDITGGVPDNSNTWSDNIPIIRMAEAYLIRAEARFMQGGKDAEALSDINTLRTNRGLTGLAVSGQAIMDAIEKERRTELCYEGHRWFDLKRWGRDINKPVQGQVIDNSDFRLLAPLPEAQVELNPSLNQNPGY